MAVSIRSLITAGSNDIVVEAECQLSNALPGIVIVGLGSKAVNEAKERIRGALANSDIQLPRKRITINLAPADVHKEATSLDLAIAMAILQAGGLLHDTLSEKQAVIGELGLDGSIRSVRGIIGKLLAGKQRGLEVFFIPRSNLEQALLVPGITVFGLSNIRELYLGLNRQGKLHGQQTGSGTLSPTLATPNDDEVTLDDVVGQATAKRALMIAASGGHNLFLSGPPGTGKSMLAKALRSLLPPLSIDEILEVTHLHSLVSADYDQLVTRRPFRSPHHSASYASVVGGGSIIRPGEITLSHRGVLFLDEFPEFNRLTIEALRQPLEDKTVTIARAKENSVYPANFILAATANPCPCGYYGTSKACVCPPHRIVQYRQKLSGPIMDRLDLYVEVEQVKHDQLLTAGSQAQSLDQTRQEVAKARILQTRRFGSSSLLNADMNNRLIKSRSCLSPEAKSGLDKAAAHLDISPRSYMRVIKVARTIADLDNSPSIGLEHVTEALRYRPRNLQSLD